MVPEMLGGNLTVGIVRGQYFVDSFRDGAVKLDIGELGQDFEESRFG